MKNNLLVSIIVVSYNSERTILETLESIKRQTYKNIETIVSDDNSKDKTLELVKNWKKNNPEIKIEILESNINTGVTKNLNRGIKFGKGEWIKLIAADDILVDSCIEENIKYLEKNPEMKICFSGVQEFSENKLGKIINVENLNNLSNDKLLKRLLVKNFLPAPSSFIKKTFLIKYNYFDERIKNVEDWPFWLKILKNNEKIYFNNKITVKYRKGESLSNNNNKVINERMLEAEKLIYELYIKEESNIFLKWHYFLYFNTSKIIIELFKNKNTASTKIFFWGCKILDPLFIYQKFHKY